MRPRAALLSSLLALVSSGAWGLDVPKSLVRVQIEGGSGDDQRFAAAALGLKSGQLVDEATFQQALAAVRLVDRFQSVEGHLGADGVAVLQLLPLQPLKTWRWEGDPVPGPLRKTLLPELRKGQRLGPQRQAQWATLAEERLREAGYPEARLQLRVAEAGRSLGLVLSLGKPSLLLQIRFQGDPAPYSQERLLKEANLEPGRTLWTPATIREAHRKLRQRLVKDGYLEGTVRLEPASEAGTMVLELKAGPKVNLRSTGINPIGVLWNQPRLSEFVPLARAERYTPSLLEEGAGRIASYFRDQGYPEVKVTYQREVSAGPADHPQAVNLTYTVVKGPRRTLGKVSFEGNREVPEKELQAVVTLPHRLLVFSPRAEAQTVKSLEDRVTAYYLQRGFTEVAVRRRVDTLVSGAVEVHLLIREGRRRTLDGLILDLPARSEFPRESLAQSLLLALSDRPRALQGTSRYPSDRRHLLGVEGTLVRTEEQVRLDFKPALPLVRNDLALVVADLRRRLNSAGSANPQVKLSFEDEDTSPVVRIQVPAQPLDQARRLVVQGSDQTRAMAVLREMELPPGAALDPLRLDEGQGHLGNLGVFQRLDLLGLKDLPGEEQQPWQRGDLALRLQERPPWVFSESFGFDNTQGYHIGLNAQRLNVGGMGRTLDFGARGGNQTLDIPFLRRAFPTGNVNRSVDSYSVGYTDPWFLPGSLDAWLPERTTFHAEGAYIEETQAAFFARRRRFTPSLEWKLSPVQSVQLGYRWERVEVAANQSTSGGQPITDQELFLLARTPPRSIISAPYLQVVVDRRDRPFDPTEGTFFQGRVEFAGQAFLTSKNSSFAKLDLRQQWNWPLGFHAENGVLMASLRLGLARPTASTSQDLPLSERFFGGGSATVRGVEPDMLGELGEVDTKDGFGNILSRTIIPLGGQVLVVANLEYRFPLFGMSSVWAEVFVDSGQVYRALNRSDVSPVSTTQTGGSTSSITSSQSAFPPLRITPGVGLIFKLGFPIKVEYAADIKRILGRPRTAVERESQLRSVLISAGYQF